MWVPFFNAVTFVLGVRHSVVFSDPDSRLLFPDLLQHSSQACHLGEGEARETRREERISSYTVLPLTYVRRTPLRIFVSSLVDIYPNPNYFQKNTRYHTRNIKPVHRRQ